jgi:hypothetical protein
MDENSDHNIDPWSTFVISDVPADGAREQELGVSAPLRDPVLAILSFPESKKNLKMMKKKKKEKLVFAATTFPRVRNHCKSNNQFYFVEILKVEKVG